MDEELEEIRKFHGHLGPYAVVGYRMGKLALKLLKARGKKLSAAVKTGSSPPVSCIIDGIQLSSCCTLGKGNISVSGEGIPAAVFTGEKRVEIRLSEKKRAEIEANGKDAEKAAQAVWETPDDELFEVG